MADHVLEHRAKYHPVTPIEATIANTATGKRTRFVANMCATHARFWRGLTEPQQDAANHISRCYAVVHGSPEKAVNLSRLVEPRTHGQMSAEREQHFRDDYRHWIDTCRGKRINHNPAVWICGEGRTFRSITKAARRRAVITMQTVWAIDVMVDLKGWR